jgi:peptidoglycan/xylan/chitin deacetylase (PgdA/CDA1 family)
VHLERLRDHVGAAGSDVSVIVYHAIGRVERSAPEWNGFVAPKRFAAQMAYLAEHRHVVGLDALFERDPAPGRPRVAVTFDDGYRSALEHAVPVLSELGLPATFFVPTKWIGARRGWGARGRELEIMSADELVELTRMGFAVESHGHAHLDYARAEPATVAHDVRESVARLTELLGSPPRYLAYPFGRVTAAAAAEAARLALRAAFVLDPPQQVTGRYALSRVPIVPADARPLFALKTSGRYVAWRHSGPVRALYGAARPIVRRRWLWP